MAHGEERVHSVSGFTDLIVLVAAGVVLTHAHDEVEDGDKGADGVRIPAEHDVAKPDIVVGRDVACGDACKGRLLVELDIVHHFQGEGEVAEVNVHAQEANDGKVAQHTVQRALTVLTNNLTNKNEPKEDSSREKLTQSPLLTCPPESR